MVNPSKTRGALYEILIRIQVFGTNCTFFRHYFGSGKGEWDGSGRGGSKSKLENGA